MDPSYERCCGKANDQLKQYETNVFVGVLSLHRAVGVTKRCGSPLCYTKWLNIFYPPKKKAQHMCFYGQNLVNSIFFEKYSVNSMRLKAFSKLDCFLKIEFVKLKFQSKIEFPKLDLDLT